MNTSSRLLSFFRTTLAAACLWSGQIHANIPGGGSGTGADVTLTSTSTTATMSNGVVSILCTKAGATINQINYTYNNGAGATTTQLLSGGYNGGQLYWSLGGFGGSAFTYSVVVNPATGDASHAKGDYAEIALLSTSTAAGTVEVHFSMRRGSPGFYVTAIWSHRAQDGAQGMGETRTNIYAGSIFNWMSVDATRNKLMPVSGSPTAIGVPTAPVEVSLWTSGLYQGRYEDKYKYSALFGTQRVWGWSSVGTGGKNVGLWDVSASAEYYNGGPMKPELMCHMGTTILNMFNGSHYEMGTDSAFTTGEVWGKVYGPYFVYCNNVPNSITDPVQASQALYNDALAQGAAEATAWPYNWFVNSAYAPASGRGTVTGKMVIHDAYNPNATAANLWVGLVQQPATSTGAYDFQDWMKPYQFWVQTDASGNFSIPAVIAGSNYTLYAFGPGAAGTFMSQAQTGGSPGFLPNIPASPFGVTVTGGATTALGNITWTPTRVGPTVFEIGYPDRTGRKFRHGEDWWVGDIGPSANSPSPVWSKWLEFPFDFPTGPNYVAGTSRWPTDWNFVQPVVYSTTGTWNSSSSNITFNLASAPAAGTQASLYLGLASNYRTALIITLNGTVLVSNGSTITATPSALPSTGFIATSQDSNSTLREGINGAFSDERITFPGTLLKAGANTIKISQRQVGGSYFADHAMYDYLRLELTSHVPPAPASVTAFAGNNSALVSWPAVPGATSYRVLRSTVSGSGYSTIATGVTGPVSGSGLTNASYVDPTALNGTTYYYVVQSTNPVNSSANSPQSVGIIPSAGAATSAPAAPTGLTATPGNGAVTLNWSAASGADLYTVKRSTLTYNGAGSTNTLNTIPLTNAVTGTSFMDTSVTNGTLYAYRVSATNAAGSSGDVSTATGTTPVATAPTAAPGNLTAVAQQNASAGSIVLNWTAAPGAMGYVVQVATSLNGTYSILASVSSLTATDSSQSPNTTYYYRVAAMNSGGTSAFVGASATTPPAAPTNLVATPGNAKVTLTWTATAGATSYVVGRSTTSGGAYTTIAAAATGTSFVDTTALNGVTYYYVVAATGAGGTGVASVQASAAPIGVTTLVWTAATNTTWDTTTSNWLNGTTATAYANGTAVVFDDDATTKTVTISGTVTPSSVLFSNATDYTFTAAGLSGATSLAKLGSGNLNISGANTFTGGTTIAEGAVVLTGGTTNAQNGLGAGTITLQGGTLTMNGYTGGNGTGYGVFANPVNIPLGSTGTWQITQRGGQSGAVTGAGTLTLQLNYIRGDISGDWSAFTGQINVLRTGADVDNFRINGTAGFGTAAINLGPSVQASTPINASNSFTIGELSGDPTAQLAGIFFNNNTPGANTATYVVGGRNTDATFAGAITNGASPSKTAITKEGTGAWTLSGACTYTGPTTVNAGTLVITGSISGSSSLTVAAKATLNLKGTLSIAGPITNDGTLRISGTSASIVSSGVFTNNGILDLINGPQSLPANFINNGTVIDSSVVAVDSITVDSNSLPTVVLSGYASHTYQLQRTGSLTVPNWQNAGDSESVPSSQVGPVPITLTDPSPVQGAKFYRVMVTDPL